MSKVWIIVIVVLIVGIGGYFLMQNKAAAPAPEETMAPINQTKSEY